MGPVVLWALLTGLVTGGVWVGIVLIQRQRRLQHDALETLDRLEGEVEGEQETRERLAELEERLEFAERLLARQEAEKKLPPS